MSQFQQQPPQQQWQQPQPQQGYQQPYQPAPQQQPYQQPYQPAPQQQPYQQPYQPAPQQQGNYQQPYQPAPQNMQQQPQRMAGPSGFQGGPQQPFNPQGMGRGIEGASDLNQADFIKQGTYWLKIERTKGGVSMKDRITYLAADLTVVRVVDNANGLGHQIGNPTVCVWKSNSFYYLREVKAFLKAALGLDQVTEQQVDLVFGPQQPLVGTVVEVSAWQMMGRNSGKPFTKIKWVREVFAAELLATLDPNVRNTFFPGGILERQAQVQGQRPQGVQAPAPQQPYQPPQAQQPQFQAPAPQQQPAAYSPVQAQQTGNGWIPPQQGYQQPAYGHGGGGGPAPNHQQTAPPGYPQQGAPPQGGFRPQ